MILKPVWFSCCVSVLNMPRAVFGWPSGLLGVGVWWFRMIGSLICLCLCGVGGLVAGFFAESLILAQDERWRRA